MENGYNWIAEVQSEQYVSGCRFSGFNCDSLEWYRWQYNTYVLVAGDKVLPVSRTKKAFHWYETFTSVLVLCIEQYEMWFCYHIVPNRWTVASLSIVCIYFNAKIKVVQLSNNVVQLSYTI